MRKKFNGVTTYSGFAGLYFLVQIYLILYRGRFDQKGMKVLDYGSGFGILKKIVKECEVTNFDIIEEFSEVNDWRDLDFNITVANHVLYNHSLEELESFCEDLSKMASRSPNGIRLISGHSTQNLITKFGMRLLGRNDAHNATKLDLKQIHRFLNENSDKNKVLFSSPTYIILEHYFGT